jgi:uncharacterized protein
MTNLALVAVSARMLAEAALHDGYGAVAVDLFGDTDTRRASRQWWPAGAPGALRPDTQCVLAALRDCARQGDVAGWVAGGGCEGQPELLAAGARVLPLIGTASAAVARLRDPLAFFGFLAAHGLPHPEVRSSLPARPQGWLLKDALGCGGWHILPAEQAGSAALSRHHYFQRQVAGTPMSATFCANGHEARLLGCNQLTVRALEQPARPYVYCGAIGPVALPPAAAQQVGRALRLLAGGFALQGLGSLDFMLDGEDVLLLEVNPRPPASMALYPGVMAAHVNACLHGLLPGPAAPRGVRGHEIVYAPRPLAIGAQGAQDLLAWPGCHDLPAPGTHFERGSPLCSLSASGDSAAQVRRALDAGCAALLQSLETP